MSCITTFRLNTITVCGNGYCNDNCYEKIAMTIDFDRPEVTNIRPAKEFCAAREAFRQNQQS